MRSLLLVPLLLALGCGAEPFEAGAQPDPLAGAAGELSEPVGQAGAAGASQSASGAAGASAQGGGGSAAGEAPGGAAGASQGGAPSAGTGGQPSAGQPTQGGSAGQPTQAPSACMPPSKTGPTSGARDCTADCADGTVPCEGSCDGMPAGGCAGKLTVGEPGSDYSVVLEPASAWTFEVAPGLCAKLTAMPGTFAEFTWGQKYPECLVIQAEEFESASAVLKQRGWVRIETDQAQGCALSCAP